MPRRAIPEMEVGDSSSGSDNEAPEEISVSTSRQQRVAQLRDIQDANRRTKEEERRRRRERNDRFRVQKEKKLQDLMKRKLPQDVLDAVSGTKGAKSAKAAKTVKAKPSRKEGDEEGEEEEEEEVDDDNDFEEESGDDDSDVGEKRGDDEDRLFDSGLEDEDENPVEGDDTFIPLSAGGQLAVATQQFLVKKKVTAAESALNFKQKRLYNPSVIPRQTAKQRRSTQAKKRSLEARK